MPFIKELNRRLTYKVGNIQKFKEDTYKTRQKYSGPNPARERQKHKTGRKYGREQHNYWLNRKEV